MMTPSPDKNIKYKKLAAEFAVDFVQSGMVVGLGHGTTAILALRQISEYLKSKKLIDLIGIPCSNFIEQEARVLGIPIGTLWGYPSVDLTIDGADEIDTKLNVIKGGGGALLQEKLVAKASQREMIIADESKLSPQLGTNYPLPVEVDSDNWQASAQYITTLGAEVNLRYGENGKIFKTDSRNFILDCDFGPIDNPEELATNLEQQAGIIEHGLFLNLATDVIIAGKNGVQHLKADSSFAKR